MGKQLTNSEFLTKLEKKQPEVFDSLIFIGEYTGLHTSIVVKTKYGYCNTEPNNLLSGKIPKIKSAVDKNQYFLNYLKEKNNSLYERLEFCSKYESAYLPILVRDKYGLLQITPTKLLQNSLPTIDSAVDKTEYWINIAKEIHGDLYDYSKSIYTKSSNKIIITCKIHGDYSTKATNHTHKGNGCMLCAHEKSSKRMSDTGSWSRSGWIEKANKSKKFSGYKLYKIKCWNDNEEFHKIGITFNDLKTRFGKNYMPYKYKIIDVVESDDGNYIWDLEKELHRKYKSFQYIPKIKFSGMYECFTTL